MQTATEHYSEDIKAARYLDKEEKKNLFIDAVGANEDMAVDDKITIEDWHVDDEFNNENVKTTENKKVPIEPIKQATEPIEQDLPYKKQPPPPYQTAVMLDDILIPPLSPNADTFKKEENEIDKMKK